MPGIVVVGICLSLVPKLIESPHLAVNSPQILSTDWTMCSAYHIWLIVGGYFILRMNAEG